MSGCQGNEQKNGPYTTGECPTIELALKELQIHIDTFHENNHKKSLKCFKAGCEFEAKFVPNSSAVELLKLHVSLHHQVKEEEDNAGANSGGKAVF